MARIFSDARKFVTYKSVLQLQLIFIISTFYNCIETFKLAVQNNKQARERTILKQNGTIASADKKTGLGKPRK
jgi:hypothetical protein